MQRREQQKGRQKYFKQRQETRKRLMTRTNRGQPILSNAIDNLLSKLESEQSAK